MVADKFKGWSEVRQNLCAVKSKISEAAVLAARNPSDVNLIAISKTQKTNLITGAIAEGHRLFGENRVQESEEKWPPLLEANNDVVLHLIGPLQTNKVKRAVKLFHAIQTLDRRKLARALAREFDSQGVQIDCFIQINIGEEPQKMGVLPEAADDFIAECRKDFFLPIVGLMCIPPVNDQVGLHFGLLSEIAKRNGLANISMGMSGDFEIAVRFGATHVRLGTAIFGARPPLNVGPE
tara:strand:+ start:89 stop:799 length:711 start_codon:yes stop_codon:yes gene_type:complete